MKANKYIIYLIISFILSIVFCFIIKEPISLSLWINIYIILIILRITDNIYDYEKDRKQKKISFTKKQLYRLNLLFVFLFFILNIYLYKKLGLFSLVFIVYIFLQEKYKILQNFLMMFLFIYFLKTYSINLFNGNIRIHGFLILTIILPIAFGIYKRRKDNDL